VAGKTAGETRNEVPESGKINWAANNRALQNNGGLNRMEVKEVRT
jgi:hypothetical protein